MRRPSPALVVAFLALSVALSGVAWAQSRIPADSVGRIQIREGAVGTKQVRDNSLQARDFNRRSLPRGRRGARGTRGRQGRPGATNITARNTSGRDIAPAPWASSARPAPAASAPPAEAAGSPGRRRRTTG
jgi:hypothetical protein